MENNKQYMITCGEMEVALLTRLLPGMKFVEVVGIPVEGGSYVLLGNPIEKKAEARLIVDSSEEPLIE